MSDINVMTDTKNEHNIPENDDSIHETNLNLSNFQLTKLLNSNTMRKLLCLEGTFKGRDGKAIVILEKKVFPEEELIIQSGFLNDEMVARKIWRNDIYGNYECFTTNEHNGINATIIHPATQKHIDKFSKKESFLVEETYELYQKITLPHIESQHFSLEWVDNILEHKAETERLIYEDTDRESGFIMVPDLKWDGQPNTLYVLALSMKRIKSIRHLNATHLPLLKNIRDNGLKTIKEKYNLHPSQLRTYFHYQPSFYHLHVHFTYLNYEAPGILAEKAHLLSAVINNIELMSDYYQKATLSFVTYKGDALCTKFQEQKILPKDDESTVIEVQN